MKSTTNFVKLAVVVSLLHPCHALAGFGNDSGGQGVFVSMLIGLAIVLVVFLIFREFFCWYWKQNEIVSLLTELRNLQKENQTALKNAAPVSATLPPVSNDDAPEVVAARKARAASLKDRNICPECFRDYSKYVLSCDNCGIRLATE